jgi:GDP-L-fucose synthase
MNIYVAGHQGMVGSAICGLLSKLGNDNVITAPREELDLLNQDAVRAFFENNKIDQIYLAAAKVGGIQANNMFPAQFIYENLVIQSNIIHFAHCNDVQHLLFLGSSCIYPKFAPQPIKEESLLSGTLESTNEPYALAKIAGIKICESYNRQYGRDYRSIMPTNLYGPGDNFHPDNSHVIPAMMRRFHEATVSDESEVTIWGSGTPKREFLHVDDMAQASIHVMNLISDKYLSETEPMLSHINVGTGEDCTIKELAEIMAKVTGFRGELNFDFSKPDGTPRKLMDVTRLTSLGWRAKIDLEQGLRETYGWFKDNINTARSV